MSLPGPTPAQLAAAQEFNVEAFTLLAVAVVFVALRTLQRGLSVGIKRFQVDDYLMIFALVCYGLETGAAYEVGHLFHGLANNGMTDEYRQQLAQDPTGIEYGLRTGGSKLQIIGWNIYSLILWSLKMCMCVFYARLTNGLDNMEIRIKIGYISIIGTYIAVVLSVLFACHPFSMNWQIYPNPGETCQPAISPVNCVVVVVLNVITDIYLMSIPLPLMFKAQMPMKRKALLLFMFSGGIFVMACGILRCTLILVNPVTGAQEAGSWAVRETFVAIIIGNLPMVYKLFRMATKHTIDTMKSQRSQHQQLDDENTKRNLPSFMYGNGYGARSGPSSQLSKKSRFLHPLSMRNATMSESDEDLQMETIKEHGVIMTTELSVQETHRMATPTAGPRSPDGSSAHIAQLREQLYAKE